MLAAIPLLLSLAAANVIPVAKRDEGSLVQRDELSIGGDVTGEIGDSLEVGIYRRDGSSLGDDLIDAIGAAINSIVHIPGVDNGNLLSDIVGAINHGLSDLGVGIEELSSSQIGQLIEKAVGEIASKLGSLFSGGLGGDLIDALKDAIGAFLGISIDPSSTSATPATSAAPVTSAPTTSFTPHVA